MNQRLHPGAIAPNFTFKTPWSEELELYSLAPQKTKVIIFLRYYGCLPCQLDIKELKEQIKLYKEKNMEVLLVLQSNPEEINAASEQKDWPFYIVCDRNAEVYKKYSVKAGSML